MRYFDRKKARIEIIPMIDIMFFLLVFFIMITLRMIPSTGIVTNLPRSSTANAMPPPKVLVALGPDGTITVGGRMLSAVELTAFLQSRDPAHVIVTIEGAKQASVQNLMTVMDACRAAGVTRIGLAARRRG
ncbi:MAG: ExbD/TolR family protein [Acidiferrobacterales bacterium]